MIRKVAKIIGGQNPKAIFWVILLLIAGISLRWQFRAYQKARDILEHQRQRQHTVYDRLMSAQTLARRQQQEEAKMTVLGQLLPDEASEQGLLLGLKRGLEMADIQFVQLNFGVRFAGDGFMEIPLEMYFRGNYRQIIAFFEYLQCYERALRIDELIIIQSGEEPSNYLNLRASAFYAIR